MEDYLARLAQSKAEEDAAMHKIGQLFQDQDGEVDEYNAPKSKAFQFGLKKKRATSVLRQLFREAGYDDLAKNISIQQRSVE